MLYLFGAAGWVLAAFAARGWWYERVGRAVKTDLLQELLADWEQRDERNEKGDVRDDRQFDAG